jgi:signal transduction histidine kinase
MVVQRADFENRRRPKRDRPEPSETVGSAPFVSRITAEITALRSILTKLDTRETADVAAELDQIAQAIQAHEEKELDKVAVLRILASAGTMILVFVHQMRAALDGLRRISAEASREQGVGPARERLSQWTDMLAAQASELGMLLGTASRAPSHSIAVSPVVEQVLATFQGYADDHGIDLENAVKPGVRTPPMRDAELHSVLLNLISNSLKAVKGTQARRIQVDARRTVKDFRLTVSDTGFGISPDRREEAFEPFVTTSAPDPVLGVGTGLGLTIVRDIAEEHDGTARFVDPPDPWSSRVVVTFPVGVSE